MFIDTDANLVEINPLILTKKNKIVCLDAKMTFDENALFKHPEIQKLRDFNEEEETEIEGILINIFGGIMRCDVLAQGVVDAAKEIKIKVPLVVRLAGTNFKEGKEILDNSGLEIISANDLSDAAKKIVEAIK